MRKSIWSHVVAPGPVQTLARAGTFLTSLQRHHVESTAVLVNGTCRMLYLDVCFRLTRSERHVSTLLCWSTTAYPSDTRSACYFLIRLVPFRLNLEDHVIIKPSDLLRIRTFDKATP